MSKPSSLDIANELRDRKQFRSAMQLLEQQPLKFADTNPGYAVLCAYNLGAMQWADVGDGVAARDSFQIAVNIIRSGRLPMTDDTVQTLLANSCENLMLMSLSYEEYGEWCRQLQALQPKNNILLGQVPFVKKAQEEGTPWYEMLQSIAMTYYNRNDPKNDPGRYGCGASTWRILLANRKMLRVKREDWGTAVYEHGALTMRMVSDAIIAMEKDPVNYKPDECLFIIDKAIEFADEYLVTDANDERITKLLSNFSEFCEAVRSEQPLNVANHHVSRSNDGPASLLKWFMRKLCGVHTCDLCRRPFSIGVNSQAFIDMPGVAIDRRKLMDGSEGVGRRCKNCGRVVCSICNQHAPCPCGVQKFEGVRLIYR
jgi:hypothetical protein